MATDNKYDRQIRIWGADGQKLLNEARILCLGISPAGTETLKNLVLPGIGHITIVSDKKVSERDLSNNFFVREEAVGSSIAKASI